MCLDIAPTLVTADNDGQCINHLWLRLRLTDMVSDVLVVVDGSAIAHGTITTAARQQLVISLVVSTDHDLTRPD